MCRGGHVLVSSPLPSYGKNSGVTLLSCVGTCAFTHVGISRYSFTPFSQPALIRESLWSESREQVMTALPSPPLGEDHAGPRGLVNNGKQSPLVK